MDQESLEKVNQAIYRKFPYMQGIEPEVSIIEGWQFLLIYKGQATTADGHALPVTIRVASDKTGKIIKMTSSR